MNLSKLWGHLGTLLAGLGAALTDFGAVHAQSDVRVVLTAVAGWLVSQHIVSSKTAGEIQTTVTSDLKGLVSDYQRVITALKTPAQPQAAAGTTYPQAPPQQG